MAENDFNNIVACTVSSVLKMTFLSNGQSGYRKIILNTARLLLLGAPRTLLSSGLFFCAVPCGFVPDVFPNFTYMERKMKSNGKPCNQHQIALYFEID